MALQTKEMMMQSDNRFFDDLAKMVNGAAGTLAGISREAEAGMKERMRGLMGGMDFVSREEFEAVKAMAATARAQADALAKRIDALEGRTSTAKTAAKPAAAKPVVAKVQPVKTTPKQAPKLAPKPVAKQAPKLAPKLTKGKTR
jgi:BMFP domain-containing protein YqiC